MLKWREDIPEGARDGFTGVITLCQYEDGTICGSQSFSTSPLDTTALDLRFNYKIRGETRGFHRTAVLKAYLFPEDESVRFIPENLIRDDIARKFKIRCINEPLRVFYQDSGNQITKAAPRKNALVKNYFLKFLNRDFDYFFHAPVTFAKRAILYIRYSLLLRARSSMNPVRFNHVSAFLLWCLAVLPGITFFCGILTSHKELEV